MRERRYNCPIYFLIIPAIDTRKTEISQIIEKYLGRIKEYRGRNGGDSYNSRNRDFKIVLREVN
jgi:hypothetical protein